MLRVTSLATPREDTHFDNSFALQHVSDASQARIMDFLWGDNNVLYVT